MEGHRDLELERAWPLFGLSSAHRDLRLCEATDKRLFLGRDQNTGTRTPPSAPGQLRDRDECGTFK
jgi:hypothetical protein